MKRMSNWPAAGLVVGWSCAVASASILQYDPSAGTLPQAQGWDFAGSFQAPMSVAGGILTYGATSVSGTTAWGHAPTDSINFLTDTVFIEATIRLSGSDFGNFSGYRRAGFSLFLRDDGGRWIIADIGDQRISLGNDDFRTNDPSAAKDMTSAFRTVRLEAGPAGGRLLVDGVQELTLALGGGMSGGARGSWGESTQLANCTQTEVLGVTFIPAPGFAALAASALAVSSLRRRRAR